MKEKEFWKKFLTNEYKVLTKTLYEFNAIVKKCRKKGVCFPDDKYFSILEHYEINDEDTYIICKEGRLYLGCIKFYNSPFDKRIAFNEIEWEQPYTSIKITTDGKITTATLKRIDGSEKSASAKCCKDDEFDFRIGAKLALDRLFLESKVEENKPYQFKVGDRVKFKSWKQMMSEGKLSDWGSIYFSDSQEIFSGYMTHLCGTYATIHNKIGNRLILKDFTTKGDVYWDYCTDMFELAKDEPYNAKIVCVKTNESTLFTKGKIYNVQDGVLYPNGKYYRYGEFKNIDDINDHLIPEFIEVVE